MHWAYHQKIASSVLYGVTATGWVSRIAQLASLCLDAWMPPTLPAWCLLADPTKLAVSTLLQACFVSCSFTLYGFDLKETHDSFHPPSAGTIV